MPFVAEDEGREALLEEVPSPTVPAIETSRVVSVEPPHPGGELRSGGLEHEVVVSTHQAVRVAAPFEEVDSRTKKLQEVKPVQILDEQRDAEVGPTGGVENSVVELATWKSWHNADRIAACSPGAESGSHSERSGHDSVTVTVTVTVRYSPAQ